MKHKAGDWVPKVLATPSIVRVLWAASAAGFRVLIFFKNAITNFLILFKLTLESAVSLFLHRRLAYSPSLHQGMIPCGGSTKPSGGLAGSWRC